MEYTGTAQKFSAKEVLLMNPIKWGIVLVVGISLYLLNAIGVITPVASTIEYFGLGTRTSVYQFSQRLDNLFSSLGNVPQLAAENRRLGQELTELQSKLAQVEVVFEENQQLINEIGTDYDREYKKIAAIVSARESDQIGLLQLNKGEKDGVKVGDIVVVEKIAVGEIVEVSEYLSEVQLVTSADVQIPVKTVAANLGILSGQNNNFLEVTEILPSNEVKVGDKVFTSGLGSNYPVDLYLGEVTEVEDDPRATTLKVVVEHPLNLQSIEKVVILQI